MRGGSDLKNLTVLGPFVLMAFLSGCRPAAAPVSVSNQPVSVNGRRITKPLAEMSWTMEDGRVEKLSDLRGKAVILDFWATYCGPCREGIPHLNSLVAKYGTENLHVVGLNVGGAEDRVKIPEFVTGTRIDYQIAFPDDDLNQFIFAESSRIPQTAVFDRSGRLVKKVIGFNTAIQQELDAAVEQAVRME